MEHSLGDQDLAQSAGAPGAEGQVVFWLGGCLRRIRQVHTWRKGLQAGVKKGRWKKQVWVAC